MIFRRFFGLRSAVIHKKKEEKNSRKSATSIEASVINESDGRTSERTTAHGRAQRQSIDSERTIDDTNIQGFLKQGTSKYTLRGYPGTNPHNLRYTRV